MKKRNAVLWLTAGLSLAAMLLRRGLYALAVDEKGLLVSNHPLALGLWAVILAGAVVIVLAVRKLDGDNTYEENFSPSNFAALGHFLMGFTVLMMVLLDTFPLAGGLRQVWKVLGILCGLGMVWTGVCRMKGKKPFFAVHAGLCLFLLLYLISRYQNWSGDPQLQNYVFELLALAAMILFAFHTAAFEAGIGKRRMQLALGLLAVLLWGAANFRAQVPALFFSGALWAAADLCRMDPPPKKDEVDVHDPA